MIDHEQLVIQDNVLMINDPVLERIAQRAAQQDDPIVVLSAGTPLAAIVGLEHYQNLLEELRCLRTLYEMATAIQYQRR